MASTTKILIIDDEQDVIDLLSLHPEEAVEPGRDLDKPRNLAKSGTVGG